MKLKPILAVIMATSLVACNVDETTTESSITLSEQARYTSGIFDASAAEIVTFDSTTQQTFVVNANSGHIDVLVAQT